MWQIMRILSVRLAVLVILIVASNASAAPVPFFDNGSFSGPQVLRNNMCAAFDDDGNCLSRFTIYDQFVLESGRVITRIEWHQIEQKPENYMGTRLTIGSGIPTVDSLLHTSLVTADRVLTPIQDNDPRFESIPSGSFESLASVSGLNIELAAGTYWLGIHNMYPHNVVPLTGGSSQWSQTSGTDQTIAGRWQGEGVVCGNFPIGPDGGCLKFFPNENSAFRLLDRVAIAIDIKPGSDPNAINARSKGVIPVAVLGSSDFDATQVDFSTVVFGPDEASPVHDGHVEDLNGDFFDDMVFHFKVNDTGIACGDTDATLTAEIFGGEAITGTDTVKTAGCK